MSSPAVVRFPVPRHIEKSITTVSPAVSTIPHSRSYEKLEFPINTIIRRIFAIHPDKIRGCLNSTSCRDRPRVCAYHCTVSLLRLRIIRTGNRKLCKFRHIDAIDPPFLFFLDQSELEGSFNLIRCVPDCEPKNRLRALRALQNIVDGPITFGKPVEQDGNLIAPRSKG